MNRVFWNGIRALVLGLWMTHTASAAPSQFTETWESYATGATPYGSWELYAGTWGTLLRQHFVDLPRPDSEPFGNFFKGSPRAP
jgi:hypothetical protein